MSLSVKMIGIGDDGRESLFPPYVEFIQNSDFLVGGERQLAFFPSYTGEKIVIKGSLKALFEQLRQLSGRVVLLASGDPFFYGIGSYALKQLDVAVEVYPNISSVQLAFARMGEAWQDAFFTSIHGRTIKGLAQRIDGREKIAILTDEVNSPNAIAKYLLEFGMMEYRVFVAEHLGGPQERTGWYSLDEMAEGLFGSLNIVILKKQHDGPNRQGLGIEDEEFAQRKPDKGLITKKEVRILSIANLKLQEDSVVWDIGTCTGSVAIECGRLARMGQIFAIEKNEADLENCKQNMMKFRVDLTAVHGKAPAGIEDFADPDAVFIGGSGGELRELLHVCCTRLRPNGRIVLNAVTIENLYDAKKAFEAEGFDVEITLVQISRSKPILTMTRFEGLNPVYIITAKRQVIEGKGEMADE
ncbi:cobalamin biosynthesis protein CbiE [Paenibacillus selenitireducens]|uniref:Cobalamin biosynthesis protein CbiE n=1 Tax=Paenibacillus selenitireducens TaxID=1324314 RepID=A0A1T2XCV2_9BACL|nr:precorrin-6y C5,15-methyltransferase (decarboxylating) subunit CbiE [Paenibacillus selenitireducens]OPA77711.1 cobalamin biosynthesis protein CbiE [Paenibacillus selenitireducens]